jgi:DNA-directed RNA polymerase specialized sigma subunit
MKEFRPDPIVAKKKGESDRVHTVNLSALRGSESPDFLDTLLKKSGQYQPEDPKMELLREFLDKQDNPKTLRPDEILTPQERTALDEIFFAGLNQVNTAKKMDLSNTRPGQLKRQILKKLRVFFIRNGGME